MKEDENYKFQEGIQGRKTTKDRGGDGIQGRKTRGL